MAAVNEISRADQLCILTQRLSREFPNFFDVKGHGAGDRATNAFIAKLNELAKNHFGVNFSQKRICPDTSFTVDFYFPEEETVVEVALSLHNPNSEYERDILKCLMAIEGGCKVRRLLFIGKPGAIVRQGHPGPVAIRKWAKTRHGLAVDVVELQR